MFPSSLVSDYTNDKWDAMLMNVYLSDTGIFRKVNRNGSKWSFPLLVAVFYLTTISPDWLWSTLSLSVIAKNKKDVNLVVQIVQQE